MVRACRRVGSRGDLCGSRRGVRRCATDSSGPTTRWRCGPGVSASTEGAPRVAEEIRRAVRDGRTKPDKIPLEANSGHLGQARGVLPLRNTTIARRDSSKTPPIRALQLAGVLPPCSSCTCAALAGSDPIPSPSVACEDSPSRTSTARPFVPDSGTSWKSAASRPLVSY